MLSSRTTAVVGLFFVFLIINTAHAATTWRLEPIIGNNHHHWAAGPNWTWARHNPMHQNGATWAVEIQKGRNPLLAEPCEKMSRGFFAHYFCVWEGDKPKKDPTYQYFKYRLVKRVESRKPGKSGASVIVFTPPSAGWYHFDLAGKVVVRAPSAGYALVTLFTLRPKAKTASQIKAIKLNKKGGVGHYPDHFSWAKTIKLSAGASFAVRLQGVNPGPASPVKVWVDFSPKLGGKFSVTKAAQPAKK